MGLWIKIVYSHNPLEASMNNKDIPLTVATEFREQYRENFLKATAKTGRLLLFAGDQKIEHMNDDFYGEGINSAAADPRHLFEIASNMNVGLFATQFGLVARYGEQYRNIRYLIKLNSRTNLVLPECDDPLSLSLVTVEQVVSFAKATGLEILGVGYTVYLGSRYEAQMLAQAAQIIQQAHAQGLLVVLWMYPRGKSVPNERAANIIAGAAGVGLCLGADFVKVNPPEGVDSFDRAQLLKQATVAAGMTKVICSGGSRKNKDDFLEEVYHQIHVGGAAGAAIGRNIHQNSLEDACKIMRALAAIIIDDEDLQAAKRFLV